MVLQKLKGWEELGRTEYRDKAPREAFTLEGFYQRLTRWAVVDDQVGRAVFLGIVTTNASVGAGDECGGLPGV